MASSEISSKVDYGQSATKGRAISHGPAAENSERLYVIRIVTTFDEIRAAREASPEKGEGAGKPPDEEIALEDYVLSMGHTDVPIEVRCIRGNTGLAASDFVDSVKADLLVVQVPAVQNPTDSLPPNISWITDVIPCNLWVIR